MGSVLGCTTCIILGQVCLLFMVFLLQECIGVWCGERQASFGAVQLFRHTIRGSLIFCAEGQSLLVQLQCSGDVTVLCLRSDLVVVQDAALQTHGCISLGWHLLEPGCTPSSQCVYEPDFSLCCVKYMVLALVAKS